MVTTSSFHYLLFLFLSLLRSIRSTDDTLTNHPVLQSLENYHFLSPQQYEDFHHNQRKTKITTELTNTPGIHISHVYFAIEFEGKKFTLDLSLNQELLPESFSTTYYSIKGEKIMHKPSHQEKNHCYYQGNVREIEGSQVIASTCNGLRGTIILPDDVLMIEPLGQNLTDHVIYRFKDQKEKSPKTCGNSNGEHDVQDLMNKFNTYSEAMNLTHKRNKREVGVQRQFVELMIVADRLEAQRYETRIVLDARIKELVNFVDGFYQKLGIRVVLSHVEVWNRTNRAEVSDNPTQTLDNFLQYRIQRMNADRRSNPDSPWLHTDNVHLLYGGDFQGSTIGMATVGSMCGSRSGGVNQDHSRSVVNTAATVAHEMGHNFGMLHDTPDCNCPRDSQCIMAASSGFNPNRDWSSCSEDYLEENIKMGVSSCLQNVPDPSRLYGGPQCGNDIVEEGEECDCGEPEFCTSQCCDAATCKLLPNAVCDGGSCCDSCQFVPAGTSCRPTKNNECELPEFCTGSSPYCPGNTYKEEGTPCLGGTAVCHDGVCLTHTMQCQSIWGPAATNGPEICYSHVNSQGNANGNCGKRSNGQFRACSSENIKCGKLLCVGGENRPLIARDRTSYFNTITQGRRVTECKTLGTDANAEDELDPGLVRSGTMCDSGKVCLEGVCQDLPVLTCSSRCNGNGICNNLQNCHCDDGFAPPFCSERGSGGSIDSGPMRGGQVFPPTTSTTRFVPRPTTTTRRTFTRRTTTTRFFPPTTTRRFFPRPTTTTRRFFPRPTTTTRRFFPRPTTTTRRSFTRPTTTTRRFFPFFPLPTTPRIVIPPRTTVPPRTTSTTIRTAVNNTLDPNSNRDTDSDKIADNVETTNTADSPVAIIVAIVLVVLVLIVVAGLVVWCRYFGGKDRLDSWRKPREKENAPTRHEFQPVPTEETSTNATVMHSANAKSDLKKQFVSMSRENLIGSSSTVYPLDQTPTHGYYDTTGTNGADNTSAYPSYNPSYHPSPSAPPQYQQATAPSPPNYAQSYSQGPPQLPKAKPPVLAASKPPLRSSPPKPISKPAPPPTKPSPLSPVKPVSKPILPTKPTQKQSPPKQVVRSAPPPPAPTSGVKYPKPHPILPTKPALKPTPSPKPITPNAASMSVAERARRFNGN